VTSWRSAALWLAVAALPLAAGLSVDRQGLDLIDDGRWLLGASRLGELHDSLRVADAPLRYLLLRAGFAVAGESAVTLDRLQALLAALCAVLLFALLRRAGCGRWALLAPLLVAALGPMPLAPPLLAALALALRARAVWLASLFALASLFGLQFAALGLALVLLDTQRPRRWLAASCGVLSALVLLVVATQLWRGALLQDAWLEPAQRWLTALRSASAWQWWDSLRHGAFPRTPFAGVATGEDLAPLFPGHATLRWLACAALYLTTVAAPLALAIFWRRTHWRGLLALSAAASLLLLARGDVPQLRAAVLSGSTLWMLANWPQRRLALGLRLCLCAMLLVPALERGWLAAMHFRTSLVQWDEPRAGALLAAPRAQRLDALLRELRAESGPLFIWPPAPGLHFLSQRALATREVVPIFGRDALATEVAAAAPDLVLLGPSGFVGPRALSRSEPSLIDSLRLHYRWIGSTVGADEEYRALRRLEPGVALSDLSLSERLPFAEMTVGNDLSPPLVPGFTIGQSVRMAGTDLEGFSLRWSSPGGEQTVPLRIWLWMQRAGERSVLLQFFDTEVRIPRDGHRSYLRFGPIDGTAGLQLALTLEVRAEPAHELRLWMHRHDEGGQRADFYPLGSALFLENEVQADLVFAAY
jgi:hypothetical protein